MKNQMVFKRYEMKYLLDAPQQAAVQKAMASHMQLDEFGHSTIRNVYYDTENYRLIRHSIEKPVYKEKLRIRSYGQEPPWEGSKIFVELKKKYESVVYKRRTVCPLHVAMRALEEKHSFSQDTQIGCEIDYFCRFYGSLRPAMFLSYEREAFFDPQGSDFRVTFDSNIVARTEEIDLRRPIYGTNLLPPGLVLMEIKTSGGIPLWMVHTMTQNGIYQTSFSKYGAAYQQLLASGPKDGAQEEGGQEDGILCGAV